MHEDFPAPRLACRQFVATGGCAGTGLRLVFSGKAQFDPILLKTPRTRGRAARIAHRHHGDPRLFHPPLQSTERPRVLQRGVLEVPPRPPGFRPSGKSRRSRARFEL